MAKSPNVRIIMLTGGSSIGRMGQKYDDSVGTWGCGNGTEVTPGVWRLPIVSAGGAMRGSRPRFH